MKNYLRIPLRFFGSLLFFVAPILVLAQDPVTFEPAFPNLDFNFPAEIQNAADGSNRLFVVEQSGRIKVFPNNAATTTQKTFLDLRNVISFSAGQEIGLLGLAFHPNYASNGYFYVYHTKSSSVPNVNVEIVLARYQVSSTDPDTANPSSRLEIFSFDKNQRESNHNGGKIAFGPDGYLYISIGDGGGGGDPQRNAQNLNNVFGSILRIDIDLNGNNPLESNPDLPNGNYEIPADNPRVGTSGLDELYAWGIRNTWKLSFDPPTSRLWAGDVGQGQREEVNLIVNGGNYGWNRFEGTRTYGNNTLVTTPDIKPVLEYNHNNGDVSITGGYVYRGTSENTRIKNKYIYGDFVSGRVWSLDYNASTGMGTSTLLFKTDGQNVSSFGLDETGEIYFSSYGNSSQIYKIVGGTNNNSNITDVNGVGSWSSVPNGVNGPINAIAVNGDNIYVGGNFSNAGNNPANNIAIYNAASGWSNLSTGANGIINAIAIAPNGDIYVGGDFSVIGGVNTNNIARWNGSSWLDIGGTNGAVAALGFDTSGTLYAGGAFATAGGLMVNNIASYDGSWSALTDAGTMASGTNNEVRSIAFDATNRLYVGGNFGSAGGKTANRIAVFNGSTWATLGNGTSGFVQAIAIDNDYIYAGGNFAIAGNQDVNRIARWNRNTNAWESLSSGVNGTVNAMRLSNGFLYVGGSFETAAPSSSTNNRVKNTARWSPNNGWEALGTMTSVGTDGIVNALSFDPNQTSLYTGGNFQQAGMAATSNIAVWTPTTAGLEDPQFNATSSLYPNPSDGFFTVSSNNQPIMSIQVFSLSGQQVIEQIALPPAQQLELNTSLSAGMYVVKIQLQDGGRISQKLLVQ